ncbi:non-ribosomal peptide synthetase [Sciscionella marina]|uniref:non-ribosomal peptide synthetase n=1 Tax=Sciscionella marina TaxID=508770 RepID=UPI00036A4C20|nr:non-ribosomal peptide synthetase [Sciscionella marina]
MSENNQDSGTPMVESAQFHRPVSPIEWWFLGHPDDLSTSTQILVEGTGWICRAQLTAAVEVASAACPGARLVRDGQTWVDSGIAPPVQVLDGRELAPAEIPLLPELQSTLAGPEVPSCAVVLIQGPVTTVAFRANHAVMDARGIVLWALDVFRALRGEGPLGAPDPVSEWDIFAELPASEELVIPGYTRTPVLGDCGPTDRTRTVAARRSVQGTHPGIVAKLATASVVAGGLDTGRFYVPVDLRYQRPDARTTANVASGFPIEVSAGEPWEQVHERLLGALADGEATRKAPPDELRTLPITQLNEAINTIDKTAREQGFPSHAVLSHTGRVDLDELRAPGFTAHTAYELARPSPGGAPELIVVEVPGRTEITVSWWDAPETTARIEALLDRIEEALSPPGQQPCGGVEAALSLPDKTNIVDRFVHQVAATPDAVAVDSPEGTLSYAALAHRSAVLAAELRERGAGRDTVVGVLADRSAAAVVAIWGVLRAGAAYLPLDSNYPDARIAELLTDADAPLCLVQHPHRERDCLADGCVPVVLEDLDYSEETPAVEADIRPEDLAYVIYTSGSTGRPKGVEVVHRGLASYAHWSVRAFGIGACSRLPVIVSLSFDVAGNSILLGPLGGGTIVLGHNEINHATLRELLTTSGADTLFLTPSHLDLIARLDLAPEGVRSVVVIGEQLRRSVAERAQRIFGPDCAIVNCYGPTEITVVMTAHTFDENTDTGPAVPIGAPTGANTVYLLDSYGRFVPEGEQGEIYLGGPQLARGYRGRPDLDQERFVQLTDGTPVYRTGDIATVLPNGELEFIGRGDDQVKVLGHRIEPAEIAHALESHPAVSGAVVLPRQRPGREQKSLCAYVICAAEVTSAELNEHVEQLLPKYMVPAATVLVDSIPLTPNGKVDARRLPDPFRREQETVDSSARDESTCAIAEIWARILELPADQISDNADFYQLGGDSVLLLAMLAAVSAEVVGAAGEARFMSALREIIREPSLVKVSGLAREARESVPAVELEVSSAEASR